MDISRIIYIIIIFIIILLLKNKTYIVEKWRDLPFNKISLKYYPGLNSEDYIAKVSLLATILNDIKIDINNNKKKIIFNQANRPIIYKNNKISEEMIILTTNIIRLINDIGNKYLKVEINNYLNALHLETDEQSQIIIIVKLKYKYYLDNYLKDDIVVLYSEYVFEKINESDNQFNFYLSDIHIII